MWRKTPKTSPSHCQMWTPSNTPIPQPTQLTTPNGIQIQLAVFPQFAHRTDRPIERQSDRWSRRQTCKNTHLLSIALTDSDAAITTTTECVVLI